MSDLEQLAGRIVMVHQGSIAFDGPFAELRRRFADRRRLILETAGDDAPTLQGAELTGSTAGRHEYVFDAAHVTVAALLDQAARQTQILDVETHRLPIDDVIADIYEQWQTETHQAVPAT
jgi:ABC-2 type transport system ATP-binding protein